MLFRSAQLYSPQGVAVKVGDLLVNSALADLLDHLIMAEKTQSGDRKRGLEAVLESFYKGEPAKEIDAFSKERDGLLARSDLECFQTHCEKPVSLQFANTTVFKCRSEEHTSNSSHKPISYAVFCLKKKKKKQ